MSTPGPADADAAAWIERPAVFERLCLSARAAPVPCADEAEVRTPDARGGGAASSRTLSLDGEDPLQLAPGPSESTGGFERHGSDDAGRGTLPVPGT